MICLIMYVASRCLLWAYYTTLYSMCGQSVCDASWFAGRLHAAPFPPALQARVADDFVFCLDLNTWHVQFKLAVV